MLATHKVHKPLLWWIGQAYFLAWCIWSCFLIMLQSIVADFLCAGGISIICDFKFWDVFTFPNCDHGMLATHKVHKALLWWRGQVCFLTWCIWSCFLVMLQSIVAEFLCAGGIIIYVISNFEMCSPCSKLWPWHVSYTQSAQISSLVDRASMFPHLVHLILFPYHAAVYCCWIFVWWHHHICDFKFWDVFTIPNFDHDMLATDKVHKPLLWWTWQLLFFAGCTCLLILHLWPFQAFWQDQKELCTCVFNLVILLFTEFLEFLSQSYVHPLMNGMEKRTALKNSQFCLLLPKLWPSQSFHKARAV
jgi:hypothetical protein